MFQSSSVPISYYQNKLKEEEWNVFEELLAELRLIEGSSVHSVNIMTDKGFVVGLSIDKHINYVPLVIEKLKKLETLMVSSDEPPSLRGLKNLTTLSIQNLKNLEFPPHYTTLGKLKFVFLPNNFLRTVPVFLQSLTELRYLDLSFNQIPSIPEYLEKNFKLQTLLLQNNRISHIHPRISSLRDLRKLNLKGNKIRALPSTFRMLLSLEELDLRDNPLDSSIKHVFHLPNLRILHLSVHHRKRYSLQLPDTIRTG